MELQGQSVNLQSNRKLNSVKFSKGMLSILIAELVLFGGWFIFYLSAKQTYPLEFKMAAMNLNLGLGALNTFLLITSSLVLSTGFVRFRNGNRFYGLVSVALMLTISALFFVGRAFEIANVYSLSNVDGFYGFFNNVSGEVFFYGLYFYLMIFHLLFTVVGIGMLKLVFFNIIGNKVTVTKYSKFENSALYWHLIMLIGILFFPLFYLFH